MVDTAHELTTQQWADLDVIWNYHQLHHPLRRCSAAVALGSFDLRVATYAAELYHDGYFPWLVFTGANSPTTAARFPDGEAVAYRAHALRQGVPDSAILLEPRASNTGENITFSRDTLQRRGIVVTDLMLICMPYMQRRAYATCAKQWPGVEIVCASEPGTLNDYLTRMTGQQRNAVDDLIGDTQRIWRHAQVGFAIAQEVPDTVTKAYYRLVAAGFDSRVLP